MREGSIKSFHRNFPGLSVPKISVGESLTAASVWGVEKVWIRKREYQDLPSKSFWSLSAENFPRGIIYCCINFGYRKSFGKREREGGGGIKIFLRSFSGLLVAKTSVRESFTAALISGIEKVWIREGEHQNFPSKFFWSPSPENFRRGVLHCCINLGYRKSLDKKRGVSEISVEILLIS